MATWVKPYFDSYSKYEIEYIPEKIDFNIGHTYTEKYVEELIEYQKPTWLIETKPKFPVGSFLESTTGRRLRVEAWHPNPSTYECLDLDTRNTSYYSPKDLTSYRRVL